MTDEEKRFENQKALQQMRNCHAEKLLERRALIQQHSQDLKIRVNQLLAKHEGRAALELQTQDHEFDVERRERDRDDSLFYGQFELEKYAGQRAIDDAYDQLAHDRRQDEVLTQAIAGLLEHGMVRILEGRASLKLERERTKQEKMRHDHDMAITPLKSALAKDELTHEEVVRLIIRVAERSIERDYAQLDAEFVKKAVAEFLNEETGH